jgi:phosphatidylglycerophosphate synthase
MVAQVVSIFLLLFALEYPILRAPAIVSLWIVVVLALVSGVDYFRRYWKETGRAAGRGTGEGGSAAS